MTKQFNVRRVPHNLEESPRTHVVHLVSSDGEKHPIFPKDEVIIEKELTNSPPRTKSWFKITVK